MVQSDSIIALPRNELIVEATVSRPIASAENLLSARRRALRAETLSQFRVAGELRPWRRPRLFASPTGTVSAVSPGMAISRQPGASVATIARPQRRLEQALRQALAAEASTAKWARAQTSLMSATWPSHSMVIEAREFAELLGRERSRFSLSQSPARRSLSGRAALAEERKASISVSTPLSASMRPT